MYKKKPEELINSRKRTAIEKQVAIYLIRRHTGLTNGEIGKIFRMRAQAVSKAWIKIERLMEKNRKTRIKLKKLISTFRLTPFFSDIKRDPQPQLMHLYLKPLQGSCLSFHTVLLEK